MPELTTSGTTATSPPSRRAAVSVDRVLLELNRLCRSSTLEFTLAVGKIIVEGFYDNDISAWRKRGAKDRSFRALARRPELPMSAGALYRSVAIYEVCERLGGAHQWKHVSTSHLRLVLGLKQDEQARLVAIAEAQRLTVNQLEREVAKVRPAISVRGGRRPLPELARTLRVIRKCIDAKGHLVGSATDLASLDPALAREIRDTIRQIRSACDALQPIFGLAAVDAARFPMLSAHAPLHERELG
jgi:hypothetical protein